MGEIEEVVEQPEPKKVEVISSVAKAPRTSLNGTWRVSKNSWYSVGDFLTS